MKPPDSLRLQTRALNRKPHEVCHMCGMPATFVLILSEGWELLTADKQMLNELPRYSSQLSEPSDTEMVPKLSLTQT